MMLESLRGKKVLFVGDSLNRGMYVSLICLLHSHIPENSKSMDTVGSLTVFSLKDYNATIEFYWAPFLLESNSDSPTVHRVSNRIVRKGSINKHGRHWRGADIVVFNTYLWWGIGYKVKILEGSFKDEKMRIVEMESYDQEEYGSIEDKGFLLPCPLLITSTFLILRSSDSTTMETITRLCNYYSNQRCLKTLFLRPCDKETEHVYV